MTCKINLLFTYHNAGGHFLDWSIRYVCGQINHDTDGVHQLLKHRNWHHHDRIVTRGFDKLKLAVQRFNQESTQEFENICVRPLAFADTVQGLHGVDLFESSHEQRNEAIAQVQQDLGQLLRWAQHQHLVPVIVDYHEPDLYSISYNNRQPADLKEQHLQDQQQRFDQILDFFYCDTRAEFKEDTVWDRREMLALIWQPDQRWPPELKGHYDQNLAHLYYNTDDLWNNFPAVLQEICVVRELDLLPDRFHTWQEIYQQWREVHDPYFGRHLDRIIDAIVHNKYVSLHRFNLNFWHEVLIQNQLIRKHNRNLRTWQLEKFPNNTQDLHQLLEPNSHLL